MSGSEKEAVLNVFAALVRPLMRAAFEYGITAGEIAGVIRRVYIQALEARLLEQRRPTTDARLAVVAGLPKSDVSSLREASRSGALHGGTRANTDQAGILLTVWHTHSNFSGAYGLAMDLDLVPVQGSPRRNFQELVDIACPGADRDILLDELLAAGSVDVVDGSTVRCLSRAYLVPASADTTRIDRVAQFLSSVSGTIVHNLLRNENDPIYFERYVMADVPMSETSRDRFMAEASDKGQTLLAELDTFLTALAAEQPTTSGKTYGVGIYFFENQAKENQTESQKVLNQASNREISAVQEIDVLAAINRKQ